jgi:hypothetical protein
MERKIQGLDLVKFHRVTMYGETVVKCLRQCARATERDTLDE